MEQVEPDRSWLPRPGLLMAGYPPARGAMRRIQRWNCGHAVRAHVHSLSQSHKEMIAI